MEDQPQQPTGKQRTKLCPFGWRICNFDCALYVAEFEMCSIKLLAIAPAMQLAAEMEGRDSTEAMVVAADEVEDTQPSDQMRKEQERFRAVQRAKDARDARE